MRVANEPRTDRCNIATILSIILSVLTAREALNNSGFTDA